MMPKTERIPELAKWFKERTGRCWPMDAATVLQFQIVLKRT